MKTDQYLPVIIKCIVLYSAFSLTSSKAAELLMHERMSSLNLTAKFAGYTENSGVL